MKNRFSINKNNQLEVWNSRRKRDTDASAAEGGVLANPIWQGTDSVGCNRNKKPLIVNGEFSIDKKNRFIYWLNAPAAWRKKYNFPSKIVLEGKWRLNPNYDLLFILNKTRSQLRGNRLAIKADIIAVDGNALVFQLRSQDRRGMSQVRLLKLTGCWQADKYNRLTFEVKKKNQPDILALKGIWQINKNQQISYTYEKSNLKTKTKILNTLTFDGFWQINNANKLTYILTRGLGSRFDFRVQIESPNLYPKKGVIKYRLGIGAKDLKSQHLRIISLYGAWKFSRAAGLLFEIEYFKGEIHSLEFGAEVNFNRNNEIAFRLKNETGEDLRVSLTFTHRFLKQLDARAFLRLKAAQEETGIDVGVRIPF